MKKQNIIIIVLLIVIFSVGVYYSNKDQKVCFGGECFLVELAKTQSEREQGLMFRESLDIEKGMLFIYDEEGSYVFWMKNTLIPLDLIWLNSKREIVDIKYNAQPCTDPCEFLIPQKPAKYILEINGKLSELKNINIGDKAKFINIK